MILALLANVEPQTIALRGAAGDAPTGFSQNATAVPIDCNDVTAVLMDCNHVTAACTECLQPVFGNLTSTPTCAEDFNAEGQFCSGGQVCMQGGGACEDVDCSAEFELFAKDCVPSGCVMCAEESAAVA